MTIDKLTMSTKWYYNIARGNNIKQGEKNERIFADDFVVDEFFVSGFETY